MLQIALIALAGLAPALLAHPRGRLIAGDLAVGLVGSLAGLCVAHIVGGLGGGLPLLVACGLALGLQSRPRGLI